MIARLAPFFLSRKGGKATRFNFSCFIFGHYFEERERKNRFFYEIKKKLKKKPSRFFFFFLRLGLPEVLKKLFVSSFFFFFSFFPSSTLFRPKLPLFAYGPCGPLLLLRKKRKTGRMAFEGSSSGSDSQATWLRPHAFFALFAFPCFSLLISIFTSSSNSPFALNKNLSFTQASVFLL